MKRLALTLILASGLATAPAAFARDAETFEIDPSHTQVIFTVGRFDFTTVFGAFTDVSGTVWIDRDSPENSRVEARAATGSAWLGDETRRTHVLGQHWLNAEANPELVFTSSGVELVDETVARVTGDLTVFGQTHPVTFDVRLNQLGTDPSNQREAAGFTVTGTIDRTEWGNTTATRLISPEVGIHIEVLAHRMDAE